MISKEEVQHIAKLARLGLNKKEIEKMQKELSSILDYFNLLREVDVSKIEPTAHSILESGKIGREDVVKKQTGEKINKLIEAVPVKKGKYVSVKAIL